MLQHQVVAAGPPATVHQHIGKRGVGNVVLYGLIHVGILKGQIRIHAQDATPVQLDKGRVNPARAQTVSITALGADSCTDNRLPGPHVHTVSVSGLNRALKVDAVDAVPPTGTQQAGVRTLVCGETKARLVVAPAQAHQSVLDTVVAPCQMGSCAQGVNGVTRHDVDHAQKSTRPIGGCIGTTDDLNALDIINGHCLQARPGTAPQKRGVDGAPIDHDLHPVGIVLQVDVVARLGCIGLKRAADFEAGDVAQQIGDIAGARGTNHGAVQQRHRPRRFIQTLRQARHGQDDGHIVEKLSFRERWQALSAGRCKQPQDARRQQGIANAPQSCSGSEMGRVISGHYF